MSLQENQPANHSQKSMHLERTYPRFTIGQRWEHTIVLLSFFVLLGTGLVQKYRTTYWSQNILSTPERLELVQNIHHIAALILTAEVLYHLGRAIFLLTKRRFSGKILLTWDDVLDGFQMFKYLLFLSGKKPEYRKFSFEQKFTYWFIFISIGIMVFSGFIVWFPIFFTKFLPGAIIPAAKLTHSTEAVVAAVFVIIWHLYHVLVERLNLSMFTGRLSELEMMTYHRREYDELVDMGKQGISPSQGGEK